MMLNRSSVELKPIPKKKQSVFRDRFAVCTKESLTVKVHPILTEQAAEANCQIADECDGLSALTERLQEIVIQQPED
jgi:hypothetical protein